MRLGTREEGHLFANNEGGGDFLDYEVVEMYSINRVKKLAGYYASVRRSPFITK